jgi:glycerol-3-phosphate acyltransferase PlsY
MRTLILILIAIISYVLGSINGAIIAGRFVFHKDVRRYGSGNAGLTNYYRAFGTPGIILLVLIDVLKTVVACLIGAALMKKYDAREVGILFAGFCVILGHMFPAYYQFRGGKGVLCGVTMAFLVDWRVGLCCLLTFLILLLFTRYVSLGSIVGSALCPVYLWIFGHEKLSIILGALCALLIVIKHAENIVRLISGRERKIDLGGRPKKRDEDDFVDP